MWGRLVICGRLAIGLPGRTASPPPVANLPHKAAKLQNSGESVILQFRSGQADQNRRGARRNMKDSNTTLQSRKIQANW